MSTPRSTLVVADPLARRARRAYELGRLRLGLSRALWAIALVVGAALWRGEAEAVLVTGVGLIGLVVGLTVVGGGLGRGVVPGLWAALPALILPLGMAAVRGGHGCAHCGLASGDFRACVVACVVGGAVAGVAAGLMVAARSRPGRDRSHAAATAAVLAVLGGTLGCTMVGAWGLAGLAIGLVGLGAPTLVLVQRIR
jgi:hypothetical protein